MKTERTLGEGLKLFRADKCLTRKELAEIAKVSVSRIGDIENDRYKNSIKSIANIVEPFGIDVVTFLKLYCGVEILDSETAKIVKESFTLIEIDNAIRILNKIKEILEVQK